MGRKKNVVVSVLVCVLIWCGGCQIDQRTTEIRSDEQMLKVSYENDRARELFETVIHGTQPETEKVKGVVLGPFSMGARYERLSFNAHCNEHVRKMDTNGDLVITEQEAQTYYKSAESSIIVEK
ncbi:MAG: hypothetical protein JXA82_10320 [Sedimentisphaerales bacterium]|nr:hypothetical protein [Sedimentisphaerales bacterium]